MSAATEAAPRRHRRDRRRALSARLAQGAGDADPPARRLRPRRGGDAGRVQGGRRAMAARRHSRQPGAVAGLGRPLQGDRRHPPAQPLRADRRRRRDRGRGDSRRRGALGRRRGDRRRPAAPDLHLLPSVALGRRAGRADAARDLGPDDRGDRARLPDCRRRRSRSASSAPRRRSAPRGFRTRCRPRPSSPSGSASVLRVDLPRLQRRLFGVGGRGADARRPVGRGDPARPPRRRAAARAAKRWACSR